MKEDAGWHDPAVPVIILTGLARSSRHRVHVQKDSKISNVSAKDVGHTAIKDDILPLQITLSSQVW